MASSSGVSPPVQRKTRASGRKVRTGCSSCKLRRVKCDEERPECARCINMGLSCGGYLHLNTQSRSASGSPPLSAKEASPMTLVQLSQAFIVHDLEQQRAIEYYFLTVAPELSGYFHRDFWTKSVFQLSREEPAILHAVITLSIEYELNTRQANLVERDFEAAHQKTGLESYNRAIQILVQKLAHPEAHSVSVSLMGCIIFVCIDCLRQNTTGALSHINGGLKLLNVWRDRCQDPIERERLFSSREYELIEETMVPIFAGLNIVSRFFGIPNFPECRITALPALPSRHFSNKERFETARDASLNQLAIAEQGLIFILTQYFGVRGSPSPEVLAQQQQLIDVIDDWSRVLDASLSNPLFLTKASANEFNIMMAMHICVRLWVLTCTASQESVWDQYKSEFEEILRLVDVVINGSVLSPGTPRRQYFMFDMGVVPVLQVVAWKCRYPQLRRKALRLLRASPRKELVLESLYAAALYERVMEVEMSAMGSDNVGYGYTDDQLPLERDRVHLIDVPPLPPTPHGRPVNFLMKPDGSQEGWHVRCEYLSFIKIEILTWNDGQDWRKDNSSVNRIQGFAPIAG